MQATRRVLPALALFSFALPATASQHLMSVRELYVGPSDDTSSQYIVLQMYSGGQNQVAGNSVVVYNATDAIVGTYTFTANVANGTNQSFILLATPAAQTRFGITPDLSMTPALVPSGGKLCFGSFDCVSWGNYIGDRINPSATGTAFQATQGLMPGRAVRRDISAGNASLLEASDDTNDSAADFDYAEAPAPRNNAGASASPAPPAPALMPTPSPAPADSGSGGGGSLSWLSALALLMFRAIRR